jgi:putative phosphoesterase
MRFGVISDVHGNLPALDAVFDDMPPVDRLVCAGDVVGYNPWPAACVADIRSRSVLTVQGNHDRAVAGEASFGFNSMAGAGVRYAREQLDADAIEWLRTLPRKRRLADDRVCIVHDHPTRRDHYTRPEEFSPDLLDGEDVLILGHTHVQSHEVFDEGIVLNPGSVGQPRDGDPKAAYAVLDLEAMTVEERRVAYDVDRVVDAVKEADLPTRIGDRLRVGE